MGLLDQTLADLRAKRMDSAYDTVRSNWYTEPLTNRVNTALDPDNRWRSNMAGNTGMQPMSTLGYMGAKVAESAQTNPAVMFSPVGGVANAGGKMASGQPLGLLDVIDAAMDAGGPALKLGGAGLSLLGTMALRGGDLAGTRKALGPMGDELGAIVYHGSPHKFDKFDSSHMGSGEGAQAYGDGLYFAENPDVAKGYARNYASEITRGKATDDQWSFLTGGTGEAPKGFAGQTGATLSGKTPTALHDAETAMRISGGDVPEAARMLRADAEDAMGVYRRNADESALHAAQRRNAAAVALENDLVNIATPDPALYKTDLPDDAIAKMLDWDAPLSEQPEAVRKAIRGMAGPNAEKLFSTSWTGRDFYRSWLGDSTTNATDRAMSELLKEQGIPGIKFYDGNSRAAGEGTRNYVTFDDDMLTILERNGETINPPPGLLGEVSGNRKFNFGKISGTREDVRAAINKEADDFASTLRDHGFNVSVKRSGSAAGPSTYVEVSDPVSGTYFRNPFRFSGHSKGPFNSQFVNEMLDTDDVESAVAAALKGRVDAGTKIDTAMTAKALQKREKSLRKRLKNPRTPAEKSVIEKDLEGVVAQLQSGNVSPGLLGSLAAGGTLGTGAYLGAEGMGDWLQGLLGDNEQRRRESINEATR